MSHVLLFNCLYEVSLVVSGIMPSLVPHTRQNTVHSTRKHFRSNRPLLGQTYPIFLLLMAIFSLSTPLLPTDTNLHPLLWRQPVRHHQQIPLKTTIRHSTTWLVKTHLVSMILAIHPPKMTRTMMTKWRRQLAR